jgi:phosphopantetheinyl transferase
MAGIRSSCGTDIQKIDPRLLHLTDRFASDSELRVLDTLPTDPETRLTILWTVKEALKKSILHNQPSIFSGIRLQKVQASASGLYLLCTVHNRQAPPVIVYICSSYIIAHTINHA